MNKFGQLVTTLGLAITLSGYDTNASSSIEDSQEKAGDAVLEILSTGIKPEYIYSQLDKNSNFLIQNINWSDGDLESNIDILDEVVTTFYKKLDLDKLGKKTILIKHSSKDHPEIQYNRNNDVIYLSTAHNLNWSQWIYQFSHELAHHVIADDDLNSTRARFSWLEESICEAASLYMLDELSEQWETSPPKEFMGNYADALKHYYNDIRTERSTNIMAVPYTRWLTANLELLYNDGVDRKKNRIIAKNLYAAFRSEPQAWMTIQYIKDIKVTESMNLNQYLKEWEKLLPEDLKESFERLSYSLFVLPEKK